jgi:replication factor C subunit 3/5
MCESLNRNVTLNNDVIRDTRPWVEKYRPDNFSDIVLDETTKELLIKMSTQKKFCNLLLYGPPGTGKTTTIVNLVNEYRRNMNEIGPGLVIHLNASDDRGVDIVRGQLSQFAQSSNMFIKGTKFVILDEADYMTIPAQIALRQLIQNYPHIRFCLICNYVSKVDTSLRNEFVRIRFNHLPSNLISSFLMDINEKEELGLTFQDVDDIRMLFGSDMRSMINFMQSTCGVRENMNIIRTNDWQILLKMCNDNKVKKVNELIRNYCKRGYGIKNIFCEFLHYIILNAEQYVTPEFLKNIEFIVHHETNNTDLILQYFINDCIGFLKHK